MNDNLIVGGMDGAVGSVVFNPDAGYGIVTSSGTVATIGAVGSSATTASTLTIKAGNPEAVLDKWQMSSFVIDHKVSEVEMMKLREVKPDYADDIKENIAKNLARDISKKVTYTKKKLPDEDTHHFIGRVWCFTTDELKQLIEDARNV